MDTRKDDYNLIDKGLRSNNFQDRRQASMAKDRVDSESSKSRELREHLVEAHRSGNRGEVERLHHELEPENRRIKESVEKYYRERKDFNG